MQADIKIAKTEVVHNCTNQLCHSYSEVTFYIAWLHAIYHITSSLSWYNLCTDP